MDKYLTTAIKDIPIVDVKQMLEDIIVQCYMDLGSKVDASEVLHLKDRVYSILTNEYRLWTWFEFDGCIRKGMVGAYGANYDYKKLTVKAVLTWLNIYNDERMRDAARSMNKLKPYVDNGDVAQRTKHGEMMLLKFKHLRGVSNWSLVSVRELVSVAESGNDPEAYILKKIANAY